MKKTLILYCSKSQGNTKKLVDAICAAHDDVDAIDATTLAKGSDPDFSQYLLIGLASGVYYGKLDKSVMMCASRSLRDDDQVFALLTYGVDIEGCLLNLTDAVRMRRATYLGEYSCKGYSDHIMIRPSQKRLMGHPDEKEIQGAVDFYDDLLEKYDGYLVETRERRNRLDIYEATHKPTIKSLATNLAAKFKKG